MITFFFFLLLLRKILGYDLSKVQLHNIFLQLYDCNDQSNCPNCNHVNIKIHLSLYIQYIPRFTQYLNCYFMQSYLFYFAFVLWNFTLHQIQNKTIR